MLTKRTWVRPRGIEEHPILPDERRLPAERSELACRILTGAILILVLAGVLALLWGTAAATP